MSTGCNFWKFYLRQQTTISMFCLGEVIKTNPDMFLQGAVPAAWSSEDPRLGPGPAGLPDVPSSSDPGLRRPARPRPALPPHHGPFCSRRGGSPTQRWWVQRWRRGRGPVVRVCPWGWKQGEADFAARSPVGDAVQPWASCGAYWLTGQEGILAGGVTGIPTYSMIQLV